MAAPDASSLWYNPTLARIGIGLSWLVVLGLLTRATRWARTQRDHDVTFGLTLVAMLLLSPVTWDHYAVLLLVPSWSSGARAAAHRGAYCLWAGGRSVADADDLLVGGHRARIETWMTLVAALWQTLTASRCRATP
jgi:hypothetical protein